MKNNPSFILFCFFLTLIFLQFVHARSSSKSSDLSLPIFKDQRDGKEYRTIEIGNQKWFAQNLNYDSPKSICYKKKKKNCEKYGQLYPYDELDVACPNGWRVPTVKDWQNLKKNFDADSIVALLHTTGWEDSNSHTNQSGLSLEGSGYQFKKKLFIGESKATTLWINQSNLYDEYYHVHIYGGKGIFFEKSKWMTNEVFHAHPIEDLDNRKFSIRCVCER